MPKMKTHRGAAKRVKLTAKGGLKRGHAYTSHILTKKSPKRKRKPAVRLTGQESQATSLAFGFEKALDCGRF